MFGIFLPKFRRRGVFAHEKTYFAKFDAVCDTSVIVSNICGLYFKAKCIA